MINYPLNIYNSKLTIYDVVSPQNRELYIPTPQLEQLLSQSMVGLSLDGLPLRTRSKVVKQEICKALGYPIPRTFKKTQPRFPGQNFDVYTQKSLNVQIWNEVIDANRRYVFLRADSKDIITNVRVITGDQLVQLDRTGTLTQKFQARMQTYMRNICSIQDSRTVALWAETNSTTDLSRVNPNDFPRKNQLLRIAEIYRRLLPLVGKSVSYIAATQERNRGAELHSMICKNLGYSVYEDDGTYPDIANQLLEIKLQTSPTIDLGLHSPEDGESIVSIDSTTFHSGDIRYAIFDGNVQGDRVYLDNLYLVTGEDFTNFFPLFQGRGTNKKLQIPLPADFFID
jgi:hypothetical protein